MRGWKPIALVVSMLSAATLAAMAAPAPSTSLGLDSSQPIAVNADSFLADLNNEIGTYTGNVIVTQGEVRLHADEVKVHAPGGRAARMEANGNVIVDSPSGQAVGDSGVYGVFVSLDLFILFLFYEIAVLPMYLLIGIWGSSGHVLPQGIFGWAFGAFGSPNVVFYGVAAFFLFNVAMNWALYARRGAKHPC